MNITCTKCKISKDSSEFWFKYKNSNIENLVPLCKSCHTMTGYNRDMWLNYFERVVK